MDILIVNSNSWNSDPPRSDLKNFKYLHHIYMTWFSFMWHLARMKRHIFFLNTASKSSENLFSPIFFYIFLLIIVWKLQKIWVLGFRRNLGCAPYAQSWVFFQNFQNTAFWLLYYSACKKATAMVFIWGDREYPAVRFKYKTASERYLVAELWAKQFWVFFEKIEILNFFENTQNVLLIYQQPNIAQRPFCIQNERQDILYYLI